MEEKNSGNSYKRKGGGSNENGIKIPNYVIDDKTRELADGERYTVCKKCGKTFEQEFYPDRNCYSSYKTCHACRWELAQAKKKKIDEKSKEEIETATAVIKFSPHPWQAKAREEFKKHRFNVWALGNRCLIEGDFIQGCNKPIEQLEEGDVVYNSNGEEQKVKYAGFNYYNGKIYTVKSVGCLDLLCNAEHKVYVCNIQRNNDKKSQDKIILDEKLIEVSELEKYELNKSQKHGNYNNYYFKMPKIKKMIKCDKWELDDGTEFPINEDTAWILGLYCAEGCYIAHSSKWTLNYKEPELAERVVKTLENLGYHTSQRIRPDEGTHCVLTYKRVLTKKIDEKIGHGSLNKHIPDDILFNKDENILVSFLKGYFAGDGYFDKRRQTLYASTISKNLALDIQMAFNRIGYFASINFYKRDKSKNADYKISVIDDNAIKLLGYSVNKKFSHQQAIKIDDNFYVPIKSISYEEKDCKIYNIETEDGTFVHNNQITGNSGKDFCANMIGIEYFVECLNENRHIEKPHLAPSVLWWIIAPTEDMAKQNWRDLKKQFPKDWIVAVSDSSYTMQTVCGGVIEVRSAYNPESLVGVGLDLCTITEAARIDYNKSGALRLVWANLEARLSSPERGLEKDRKGKKYGVGKAIINSTPLGKNFFYEMFKWGQPTSDTYDSNWYSLQEPWTCNPANKELADTIVKTKYGNMRYEDSLRRRIGDRKFRENYLADFLAGDGTVFKDFDENCVVNIYQGEYERLTKAERENFIKEWREPKPYGVYRIGYDPATGSSADDPAIVIRDMSDNKIVWIESMYGKNYDEQYERIAYLSRRYNYAECCWLRTGHTAIEGNLAKRGVVEVPLNEQNKKGEYIQSLEAAVQNKDIKVLGTQDDTTQILIAQMNDYTEVKGKYSNKSTEHDDFVSALYAVYYDYSVQTESQIPIFYANIKTF